MSTAENKKLMQDIFGELAKGNNTPLIEALAEDVKWTHMGTITWTKTFEGKEAVLNTLMDTMDSSRGVGK